ncbi:hypothetical protein UWK_02238 [Desulfocapsa sulfexigens DSM 10523]|uniref:Organic solvent tolerance-like N-terminal domain-containing protein n=1 Tax=Desulfocapsa sulfexigens (strain DSM 10523 / SB164P1) TaxID=1167006 RepID=M1NGL0_DESSD|nr:LptA/OstA family protein [Desulfocapsa sulfexigens]AGF78779.1 hypothetical protein UWK_02238 [Desulfocapsa sulfexigens DSM 10523]
MNTKKPIALFTILLAIASYVPQIKAAEGYIGASKLHVIGDYWEFKNKENIIIITKDVVATSTNMKIECQKLVILHENISNSGDEKMAEKVKKLIATNDVKIQINNGHSTSSGKAEYDKEDDKIILTEHPIAYLGEHEVTGCKITYYIENASYEVESCPDQKATGTITPK